MLAFWVLNNLIFIVIISFILMFLFKDILFFFLPSLILMFAIFADLLVELFQKPKREQSKNSLQTFDANLNYKENYQRQIKYREVKQVERDRDIREVCLMRAGYQCEINSEHTSFTSSNGRQYVESHHIIPLKYQDKFDFNLDSPENLIALCPNCHKAIHYGSRRTKEDILKMICEVRPIIEYSKLMSYYN